MKLRGIFHVLNFLNSIFSEQEGQEALHGPQEHGFRQVGRVFPL